MDNMTVMTGDVLDMNEYKTYGEYKAALDGELQRYTESFVRIGYLLKMARDSDILKESGYSSVNEFADKEYGLDKSQVSRFIRINDKFSENGYSDQLQERYSSFGYTKLAMMLLLPTEINEELSGRYSKVDIQAIREEVDAEKEKTDIEVMLEKKDERQQGRSALGKVIHQLCRDDPDMYLRIHDAICGEGPVIEEIIDALAPSGEAIISVRIAGEGRKMLSIKGTAVDPVLIDIRSGEKKSYTWIQLISEMEILCQDAEDGRKTWEILYEEPFPVKEAEVAPVQPKKEQGSRKVSKVTKAKKPEKTRVESMQEEERDGGQENQTEQAEGQNRQEAAGGENEESREDETQETDCADGRQTEEHSVDPESADAEDGTAGGAGEDSSGGGADSESGAGAAPEQPNDGQIEKQMDITDYPEYMSDAEGGVQESPPAAAGGAKEPEKPGMTRAEEKTAGAAGLENIGGKIKDSYGLMEHIDNQKKLIKEILRIMGLRCDEGDWDGLTEKARAVITRAESIKNMEEMWHV